MKLTFKISSFRPKSYFAVPVRVHFSTSVIKTNVKPINPPNNLLWNAPILPNFNFIHRAYSTQAPTTLYSFSVKDINGSDINLKSFAGKVLLVVNVASQCGLTKSNYTELQQLYEKHKSSGLEILAFPSNQFGQQEPGSNSQICEFARTKYSATFPLFQKIDVNGSAAHPLYSFLKQEAEENKGQDISWNFEKFLVDKEGNVVKIQPQNQPNQNRS